MYRVFNKTLLTSEMRDLTKVFDPFKLITVKQQVKELGRYEDNLWVVTL